MKTYVFTVTATLCEDEELTREEARQDLEEWLKINENDSDFRGCSSFEKIDIE